MTYDAVLQTVLDREPEPAGGVVGTEVDYDADGTPARGYLAVPGDATGPLPAVLVVHDWLGVTDATRMRCDMLARIGYVAFAADVYGADLRPSDAEASQAAGRFYGDRELWRGRLAAALQRLQAEPAADTERLAAIGYCFGGSSALELARIGADLRAVVSFHGGLPTGAEGEAARIRAKLLVLTGAADPVVPDEAVKAFEDEMRTAPDLDWQVVTYSGAMHAFTVPTADAPDHGAAYDERADRRSWTAMKDFFAEALG
ncbi:dienelactone hydrolase family protein [Amnibacterium setariae]|uniref:Dienelactone hydrolase family protein n=1 Tax=Amnibacterium setariae TaxID=2306585 RepID=A0A3A1TSV0_9MICO|nr:dienelactone hydrolase family protein [Amnibacterium setariae]RIX26433.1 dienelactone hydrolase family protein [Amnibacterium setariae]